MASRPASAKSKGQQYGHIKESIRKQGKSDALAEELAAQTVDRRRAPRGEGEVVPESGGQRPSGDPDEPRRRKR